MRIEFHPAALQELIDSTRYYENRLLGLGSGFKSELDRTLDLLSKNPELKPCQKINLSRISGPGFLPDFSVPDFSRGAYGSGITKSD